MIVIADTGGQCVGLLSVFSSCVFLYMGGNDPIFICLTSYLLCVLAHLLLSSLLLVVLLSLFPVGTPDRSRLLFGPLPLTLKSCFGQRQFDISAVV